MREPVIGRLDPGRIPVRLVTAQALETRDHWTLRVDDRDAVAIATRLVAAAAGQLERDPTSGAPCTERDALARLDRVGSDDDPATLARAVLDPRRLGRDALARTEAALDDFVRGGDRPLGDAIRAAWSFWPAGTPLTITAVAEEPLERCVWLVEGARPWLGPVTLRTTAAVWHRFAARFPRAAQYCNAEAGGPDAVTARPDDTPANHAPAEVARGEPDRLRDVAVRALERVRHDHSAAATSRARSAVEAYFWKVLESRPATRGRFRLNETLAFPFGVGPCEVDFLDRQARIALELDGHWHFVDAEAFRRDRRKDVLLQQQGWLVVRILADDVLDHLTDVLDLVDDVLARRRPRSWGTNP